MTPNKVKVEFIVGTVVDREGNQMTEEFRQRAKLFFESTLLTEFKGYSSTAVTGKWVNAAGRVADDVSLVYTVITEPSEAPLDRLERLQVLAKDLFYQESVVLVVTPVYASF